MSAYSLPAVATPMNRFSTQYRNCLLQRLRGNLLALEVWTRRRKLGLFEPFPIKVQDPEPIRPDDPDLQRALQLHSLKFNK
jgi:hypothetical protein